MPEIPDEVYDLAYEAFKRAPLGSSTMRAIVDAVWPLAVAEGRRQAAEVARADAGERRRLAKDASERQQDGDSEADRHKQRFLAQATVLEQVAARIAEGANGG